MSTAINPALISRIEQFYYREARLLDERQYQQWFELADPEIEYSMPGRLVPQPVTADQGDEVFLSTERELDRAQDGQGSPIRLDRYMDLLVRASRPYNARAWAESPPPRTRRLVSNVEVSEGSQGRWEVRSNFILFYSHCGADNHFYAGGRLDLLKDEGGELRIFRREVVMDWDIVTAPTLALLF